MLTRARKGFTLLELIVVIVILGILAALAIPTFTAVINRSKDSSIETTAKSVGRDAVALAAFDERGAHQTNNGVDTLDDGGFLFEAADEAGATATANGSNYRITKDSKSACISIAPSVNGTVAVVTCAP